LVFAEGSPKRKAIEALAGQILDKLPEKLRNGEGTVETVSPVKR
jgi:hypothetical protein